MQPMEQENSNLDINLLLEAIETYDYYTATQRSILKIIAQTSVNGCSKITTSFLAEQVNVSRTAIYKCLKKFVREGDIVIDVLSKRQRMILLNTEAMKNIISLHRAKQNIKPST